MQLPRRPMTPPTDMDSDGDSDFEVICSPAVLKQQPNPAVAPSYSKEQIELRSSQKDLPFRQTNPDDSFVLPHLRRIIRWLTLSTLVIAVAVATAMALLEPIPPGKQLAHLVLQWSGGTASTDPDLKLEQVLEHIHHTVECYRHWLKWADDSLPNMLVSYLDRLAKMLDIPFFLDGCSGRQFHIQVLAVVMTFSCATAYLWRSLFPSSSVGVQHTVFKTALTIVVAWIVIMIISRRRWSKLVKTVTETTRLQDSTWRRLGAGENETKSVAQGR